ncbi:hypothetical protein, partial [Streptomyces sp. A012304]|uniref:hypothetical protein n=1 Tax=Streptomyces sp. A012304 TaxID=375446 RepID=UPI00222ED6D7
MTNPLIVPVQVNAYLVNRREQPDIGLGIWSLDVSDPTSLAHPPQEYPFKRTGGPVGLGVYLHWLLPDALRAPRDGEFPLVPNRWLVVRSLRTTAEAEPDLATWVVQSDYLDPDEGTSNYIDTGSWTGTGIGRAVAVGAEEPGNAPFLTAVGPGIPAFCGYRPYNDNVFSFHDPLGWDTAGTTPADAVSQGILDYLVVGWYAQRSADVLTGDGRHLGELLTSLGWTWEDDGPAPDRVSMYAGTSLRMRWDVDGEPPDSDMPDTTDVWLSVGNSTADAQSAPGLHGPQQDMAVGRLFQAFLAGHLSRLDEDAESLDHALHKSWFEPRASGYVWEIADRPGTAPPPDTQELEKERDWLADLNDRQRRHDIAARHAAGLRRRMYDLWRMRSADDPDDGRPDGFTDRTGPVLDALTTELRAALTEAAESLAGVPALPTGATEEALAQAVAAYADHYGLPPGRELKRIPSPPFHVPNDPVLLLGNVGAGKPNPAQELLCRTPSQLISAVLIGGRTQGPFLDPGKTSWVAGLPEPLRGAFAGLVTEFSLLARAAATGSTAEESDLAEDLEHPDSGFTGRLAPFTGCWRQPWTPVYLLWSMDWYPVPLTPDDPGNGYAWTFDESVGRYRLTREGRPADIEPRKLNGRCSLTALPQFLVRARAEQHARTHPGAPRQALEELADRADVFGEISQKLEGFNRSLLQRVDGYGVVPDADDPLADVLEDHPDDGFPLPDPALGLGEHAPVLFDPVRAGQAVFTRLVVVDSSGRHLPLLLGGDELSWNPPHRSAAVTPDTDAQGAVTAATSRADNLFVQLTPRLVQPARLRFDFVSATDGTTVVGDPPVVGTAGKPAPGPVAGWLLVNHLTGTLLVHDPAGHGVVEGRIGLSPDGPAVDWAVLPGCPYSEPVAGDGDLARACPELFGFLSGLRQGGAEALAALSQCIDDASWATSSPGTDGAALAPLIGRPVALLRARLLLDIDTLPFTDPSWQGAETFPAPDFLEQRWRWDIRLGDHPMLGDGLIGYYTHPGRPVDTGLATDYTVLHTVAPGRPDGYARSARPGGLMLPVNEAPEPGRPWTPVTAHVTLLADPWQAVHAVSDILPAAALRLPDESLRGPLTNLRIAFRAGPLLAGTRPAPDTGQAPDTGPPSDRAPDAGPATTVVMPSPSAWTGVWGWSEPRPGLESGTPQGPGDWDSYPITPADTAAHPDQPAPTARTGYLTLTTTLGQ